MTEEDQIDVLMGLVGADPSNVAARKYLRAALDFIRGIAHTRTLADEARKMAPSVQQKAQRPADRNRNLRAVGKAARALRTAYSKLDAPTRIAIYRASWRGLPQPPQFEVELPQRSPAWKRPYGPPFGPYRPDGSDLAASLEGALDPQHDTLSRLLRDDRDNGTAMDNLFADLEAFAQDAEGETRDGAPRDRATDQIVEMLATFAERYGKRTPSEKEDGQFHTFVQEVYAVAGEDRDLISVVRHVIRSRRRRQN